MRVTATIEGGAELKAKLQALASGVSGVLQVAAEAGAEVIAAEAERLAPGPHIEMAPGKVTNARAQVFIGPDDDHWYYKFLETGAGDHEITPATKQALAFLGAEGPVVAKIVAHPGLDAEPFLRPAIDSQTAPATDAAGRILRREIARIAGG